MKTLKKGQLSLSQIDDHLKRLDLQPVLKSQARQVKWLFNNGNKRTIVYNEKLVRIMIHRMQEEIDNLTKLYNETHLQLIKIQQENE
jgi:hypothetical protein